MKCNTGTLMLRSGFEGSLLHLCCLLLPAELTHYPYLITQSGCWWLLLLLQLLLLLGWGVKAHALLRVMSTSVLHPKHSAISVKVTRPAITRPYPAQRESRHDCLSLHSKGHLKMVLQYASHCYVSVNVFYDFPSHHFCLSIIISRFIHLHTQFTCCSSSWATWAPGPTASP